MWPVAQRRDIQMTEQVGLTFIVLSTVKPTLQMHLRLERRNVQ